MGSTLGVLGEVVGHPWGPCGGVMKLHLEAEPILHPPAPTASRKTCPRRRAAPSPDAVAVALGARRLRRGRRRRSGRRRAVLAGCVGVGVDAVSLVHLPSGHSVAQNNANMVPWYETFRGPKQRDPQEARASPARRRRRRARASRPAHPRRGRPPRRVCRRPRAPRRRPRSAPGSPGRTRRPRRQLRRPPSSRPTSQPSPGRG